MADALTTAWQNAEKTGNYDGLAAMLEGMTAGQLMSTYGLSNNDVAYINNMTGAKLAATPQEASSMLWNTLRSDPAATFKDVLAAGNNLGLDEAAVRAAYQDVGNKAYQNQFGRDATGRDLTDAAYYLIQGIGSLDAGQRLLNNTQEGYNYDTKDIVEAYRETFGRNPTQEEYVATMAQLGVENFDRSSLGESGKYKAATVAALESDPYAGRYAGFNPYNVPADAVNVSTNILGDKVQYKSPVTQRPVVASFENGQLKLTRGQDTLSADDISKAIAVATASKALTADDVKNLKAGVNNAKTIDDLYAVLGDPQATAILGDAGKQIGVNNKVFDDSVRKNDLSTILNDQDTNLIDNNLTTDKKTKLVNNGDDNSILETNDWKTILNDQDTNIIKDDSWKDVLDTVYKDDKAKVTSDVLNDDLKSNLTTDYKNSVNKAIQFGTQNGLNLQSSMQDPSVFRNLGTFGAAGNERLGAGPANYQSDLIKSLREADNRLKSDNTGITKYGYLGANQSTHDFNLNSGGAFNPGVFTQNLASANDVKNWNAYNSYKIDALRGQGGQMLNFEDWLAAQNNSQAALKQTSATDQFQNSGTVGGGA